MYRYHFHTAVMWFISGMAAAVAATPTEPDPVEVRAIAEVESRMVVHGREVRKLLPADRVVSGDWIIYTLEVRNTAPTTLHNPTVTYPVPEHMSYVADSAVGPATDVSFSVDGGHSFDAPENLRLQDADGQGHLAAAAEYTHIRWQLKHGLKGNSVAFVRFRARVK
ncbi:MAG TPA: hypothetical protein VK794_11240 [Steroidobacteraceae bacterium]|jgi:uncharacterized repeat protein (TIGR01451 family)|nr:hypothetical protein [Steroidobacteraceae bacterium]